ncbi:MAG TPA: HlyC/CorC family transporter [Deltaproteobacteria bacterium]|nr:HlyC/CorC family transporter [Deltaproteobacteria bacterium]
MPGLVLLATGGMEVGVGPLTTLAIALCFVGSFFFSGTETAYFSLQKVDQEWFSRARGAGRQVVWLLDRRAALITTILLGNETVNIALSATCAGLVSSWFPSMPWLNVILLTPVLVLISEITPKILAYRYRRSWARLAAWPLSVFYWLVLPFRIVLSLIVSAIASLLGAERDVPQGMHPEELMVLVDSGAATGALDPLERDIIEAVFEFDGMTVERLMTPRPDVFAIPLNTGWEALLEQTRAAGHSRIPITGSTQDDIVGVLLLKDLLRFRDEPFAGPRQLRSLLLPPIFVPTSKHADEMLEEFLERRFHMAFVVDEHGTLVGLVTLDDLLHELLGEEDDTDDSDIARLRPDALTVKASIDVADFAEETGIDLPEGDYHTLGGFVFHELGRLPRKGDTVAVHGHRFVVAKMEGRRIAEVIVRSPMVGQEAV